MKTKNIYLITTIAGASLTVLTLLNTDRITYRYGPLGALAAITSTSLLTATQGYSLKKKISLARQFKIQNQDIIDSSVLVWQLIDYEGQENYLNELSKICQRKLTSEDLKK